MSVSFAVGGSVLLAMVMGCGANTVAPAAKVASACATSAETGPNASVPVLITSDAALGPLLAFELQVDSVTLTSSCGGSVALLEQPLTVEWTHVNGTSEPLLIASVPQGTYTSATVTYENPNVAYLWPTQKDFVSNQVTTGVVTAEVDFPAQIVIDGNASSILLDTLLAQPVKTDSKTDMVTPSFQVTQERVAASPTIDNNGKETLRGLIAAASGTQITVLNQAGVSLAVKLSGATQYQGIQNAVSLVAGSPVSLDVATQMDGSLAATRVQVENPSAVGDWAGPLVVSYPQGAFGEVIPRQAENSQNTAESFANFPSYFALTGTQYQLSGSAIDLVHIPFAPNFAGFGDTALGQGLSVTYTTQQQTASQPATQARTTTLIPRNFSGTISSVADNGAYTAYTLTLAQNDLLTTMNGVSSVTAYVNDGTQIETSAPLNAGSTVNMHGLLFNDGGTLRLVCDQVRLQGSAE